MFVMVKRTRLLCFNSCDFDKNIKVYFFNSFVSVLHIA